MYLRKLWLIIAVLGAMCSPMAFGLGLGEITLNSNLNQPLDAEIRLLQVGDLSQQEIFVQLGSPEDFERRGIERDFFLLNIDFEVRLNSPQGPIIKLTTREPVVEPLLSFIVQLEWPSGKIQREYNLLMDLPVFTERPAQPVQQPRAQPQPQPPVQPSQPEPQPVQPAPQQPERSTAAAPPPPLPTRPDSPQPSRPQPRPEPTTPSRPSPQPDPLSPSLQSGESYQVVSNDTLWEIALRTRPNRGVSVQQTMLALQRLNPDAFINNNINLLKEGQVLRIPSEAEIQQLDRQSAVNEVAYQNTEWSGDPDGRLARGAELQGSRTATRDDTAEDTRRGQLTLASPGDTPRATGDRSGGSLSASERDALENELAITLEQLDASERESAELNERIEELEEQISTMERLIEVSNEDMRQLQLALEDNAANTTEPAPGDEPTVEETPADTTTDTSEPADVPAATPQPQQPAVAPVQPGQPRQSIVDMLMDYIWYIGIGVVVILLGAFYLWHRKTQAEMASFDDFDQETFDEQDNLDFAGDNFEDEGFDPEAQDDFDLGMDESAVEDEAPVMEEPAAPTEAETGDAVGEADIYIAYGKYDQAEEMLQRAIIKEPDNVDARLKLLEVYSETANADKFDGEYSKLLALGDASANARAAELRGNIPGIGQYQTPAGAAPAATAPARDSGDDDLDFDLDLGGDETQSTSAASGESFDFDLDEDGDDRFANLDLGEDRSDEQTPEPAAEAEDDSIDFNLDLDDDSELSLDSDDDGDLTLDLDGDDDVSGGFELDTDSDDQTLSLDLDDDDDLSFDLDADESEFDKQFDTSLDEEPADSGTNETLSRDFDFDEPSEPAAGKKHGGAEDDILSDLEFSAANLASEQDKDENLAESASALDVDTSGGADEDDDDFDLDMGDVDLAALDEEMDALVGDLDDVDDEDVAVSPTDVVPALSDDDLDSAGFDFDEADSAPESKPAPEPKPAATSAADDEAGLEEDSELDFLADTDEVATKLDLARAYIDMGDQEGAKDILGEVVAEGTDEQRHEAEELLGKIK